MRTNLGVTFVSRPNGSHSLWTNRVGKPEQACDRWRGVDGWLLDNVCCSQDSAIMTQNGIRKSSAEAVSLHTHGNLHKHNRRAEQSKFPSPRKRQVWTQLPAAGTDWRRMNIPGFNNSFLPALFPAQTPPLSTTPPWLLCPASSAIKKMGH